MVSREQVADRALYRASDQSWPAGDVITHFAFLATAQLRTPLRVLQRHQDIWTDRSKNPPQIAASPWQGIWVPQTRLSERMSATSMMASEIGPIPLHGGDFLRFLLIIREIAESNRSSQKRCDLIEAECRSESWTSFMGRLGGPSAVSDRFIGRVPKK